MRKKNKTPKPLDEKSQFFTVTTLALVRVVSKPLLANDPTDAAQRFTQAARYDQLLRNITPPEPVGEVEFAEIQEISILPFPEERDSKETVLYPED